MYKYIIRWVKYSCQYFTKWTGCCGSDSILKWGEITEVQRKMAYSHRLGGIIIG